MGVYTITMPITPMQQKRFVRERFHLISVEIVFLGYCKYVFPVVARPDPEL